MRTAAAAVILTLVIRATPASAQETPPAPDPEVSGTVSNLTRVETWRFFEPPSPDVDPDYSFFGNRTDLGLHVGGRRIDLDGGFSYVRAERLPTAAIGPGGLGTGAFYFAASGLPFSYQVFLTRLTLSLHTPDRGWHIAVGRMPYTSGAEAEDDSSSNSPLSETRRLAVDGRLIGSFDWSLYQRRFDGGRLHWRGRRTYAGGGAFLVTQGGYEESANLTMSRLSVSAAYAGFRHGPAVEAGGHAEAETQAFGVIYRDRRAVEIRPDNAFLAATAADVTVTTVGASHVASRQYGPGRLDYAAWAALQNGDWYGQTHRAFAAALQAGYRWRDAGGMPWLRGGVSYASGDGDGRDDRHHTFFPLLQESRTYARSMVYAHANLRDLFAELLVDPHDRVGLRAGVHRLDLVEPRDRWYQGSGATAADGFFFGYSTRPSSGERGLGTVADASADLRLSRFWSVNAYAGRMWGGPVVAGLFSDGRLFYWYVENLLQFTLRR